MMIRRLTWSGCEEKSGGEGGRLEEGMKGVIYRLGKREVGGRGRERGGNDDIYSIYQCVEEQNVGQRVKEVKEM